MQYPTPQEILSSRPPRIDVFLPVIKAWKQENWKGWKTQDSSDRMQALKELVEDIYAAWNNNRTTDYKAPPSMDLSAGIYAYNWATNTILFDHNHPSVISTLHELGHYLYGREELDACRFSVWLFKEAFPGSYRKLHFDGHMLKK